MLPELVDDFDGCFWIEFEDGVCKLNVSVKLAEFTAKKKEELINIAKNKKNAAAVGIVGKIRSSVENIFLDADNVQAQAMSAESFRLATGYCDSVDYSYLWSLEQYRSTVKQEKKAEAWDELEKSVIASVADDVIVGVKGKQVNIIIVKNFS